MTPLPTLAIAGAGPSALYLLRHSLDGIEVFKRRFGRILVFEKQGQAGPGMPYSPEQNSTLNLSNISSEELPKLPVTFTAWLSAQSPERLAELGVEPPIKDDAIYPRVALGAYFQAQFQTLCQRLGQAGVPVEIHTGHEVKDIGPQDSNGAFLVTAEGLPPFSCGAVVIATGHSLPPDQQPGRWYASPWPIHKLLPPRGQWHDHPIGLLGASLSAVDVVNVLAHRHGSFVREGARLAFQAHPECPRFKMVMHSADGMLSHLQFEQDFPVRELYRHCTEDDILSLRDAAGKLPLAHYFDSICKRVLISAFEKDDMPAEADALRRPKFSFREFAEMMTEEHLSPRPFEQMKEEYREASLALRRERPTHWKEVLDDLMYTLNFHAGSLPAEDHVELRSKILPFVMNVMAALPLESAKILIALHDSGRLELINGSARAGSGEPESPIRVIVEQDGSPAGVYEYQMFVDCTGQGTVDLEHFPFRSLVKAGCVRAARAGFSPGALENPGKGKTLRTPEGQLLLELGGIEVTAGYQAVASDGEPVTGLYDLAMPHVAGMRPYCYGLQACDEAARILLGDLLKTEAPIPN